MIDHKKHYYKIFLRKYFLEQYCLLSRQVGCVHLYKRVVRVVNAVGRSANVRGATCGGVCGGGGARSVRRGAGARTAGVLGSRRRRGASEAAIDEARTRLAHAATTATATPSLHSLLIPSTYLHVPF